MSRYEILAGVVVIASESSMVLACGAARDLARAKPGVLVSVLRDGHPAAVARYRLVGNKLERWVVA